MSAEVHDFKGPDSGKTDMESSRSNLGRGLSALFGEDNDDYSDLDRVRASKDVPIEQIHPNPRQPRTLFDDEAIKTLSESIAQNGVLQPILVRRHPEKASEYEIVAGERRWRAAQRAKLHQVPVVIREIDEGQALELALVENLQREDLSPIEEAEAYKRLMEQFSHGQDALGRIVGKSRSHVANTLRLLGLPEGVKALINEGKLSAGHARPLIGLDDAESLAEQIVAKDLSVRDTEALIRVRKGVEKASPGTAKAGAAAAEPAVQKDADTLALERDLSELLGLRVSIEIQGRHGGGCLSIHYKTLEQLDDVLQRLNQGGHGD